MAPETLIIGSICCLILLLVALTYIVETFTGGPWRRFAHANRLEFRPVRLWRARHQLKGTWKGWPVTITVQQVDQSRGKGDACAAAYNQYLAAEMLIPVKYTLFVGMAKLLLDLWRSQRITVVEVPVKELDDRKPGFWTGFNRSGGEPSNPVIDAIKKTRPLTWIEKGLVFTGEKGLVEKDPALRILLDDAIAAASVLKWIPQPAAARLSLRANRKRYISG